MAQISAQRVSIQSVWMQKHPTPAHAGGEYHWYPDTVDREIVDRIASLELGLRERPLSVCAFAPDHVLWLRSFTAVAPNEQRTYTGLSGVIARGRERADWSMLVSQVLASLPLPDNQPWAPTTGETPGHIVVTPAQRGPLPPDAWGDGRPTPDSAFEIARALWLGGCIRWPNALSTAQPALIGRLVAWLPTQARVRTRQLLLSSERIPSRSLQSMPGLDNILHYLARSWVAPLEYGTALTGLACHAWRLVDEYLQTTGLEIEALFEELGRITSQWTDADALRTYILDTCQLQASDIKRMTRRAPAPVFGVEDKASHQFTRLLHYWGRGFLNESDLPTHLARILALRTIVDHLLYLESPEQIGDPRRYLNRLQYEAVLTSEHAADMRARVSGLIPGAFLRPERNR